MRGMGWAGRLRGRRGSGRGLRGRCRDRCVVVGEEDAEGDEDDAEGEEEDGELDADGDIDVVG